MSAAGGEPLLRVYIGTYTGPKSQGIYTAEFNPATGQLRGLELAATTRNPTFLALHPKRPLLYAVEEIGNFGGKHEGGISAFSIDESRGKLLLLNQQPSGGSGPCHLCVDETGSCVLVANYNSGSVAAFPLEPDGRLGAASTILQHQGSSINHDRQSGPHAHFITAAPGNRIAFTCDLGLDKVLGYWLVPGSAPTHLENKASVLVSVKPGSGPRHLAFTPNGKFVYLINELSSTLTAFSYDAAAARMTELQTVSTLPADFKGQNTAAEVQVARSGRFVYGSNRGDDSIAVFAIDGPTGNLTFVQRQPTQGRTPRHFTFDPTGRWLLVEHQDSNSIVIFKVDPASGKLTTANEQIEVGAPVCLLFASSRF